MRYRTVFSTNAVIGRFGVGGPGAYLLRTLLDAYPPSLAFARGCADPELAAAAVRTVHRPWWRRRLAGTRLHRFQARSQKDERLELDRLVASRLPSCDLALVENSTGLRTLRRAREHGAKVLLKFNNHPFDLMGADVEEERRRWGGGPSFFVDDELVRLTTAEMQEADLVFAMSNQVVNALAERGVARERLRRARYGVDTDRFLPAPEPAPGFTVGFVGWLDLRKGYPYLVEAFREAAVPGSRLVLHGGSNDRFHHGLVERLAAGAAVDVVRGPVEETYRRCAVTVLPSVSDAFGNVVLESMACGVPAIVTDRCGASEEVEDGVTGFVVPARDAGAIAEKLRLLHADPERCREMGRAAREAAVARPWSRFDEDIRDIVGTALERPPASR